MAEKMTFKYDREADILYINKRFPYPEQDSEEARDDVIARFNPETGDIENIEVLFFFNPVATVRYFEIPVAIRDPETKVCDARE